MKIINTTTATMTQISHLGNLPILTVSVPPHPVADAAGASCFATAGFCVTSAGSSAHRPLVPSFLLPLFPSLRSAPSASWPHLFIRHPGLPCRFGVLSMCTEEPVTSVPVLIQDEPYRQWRYDPSCNTQLWLDQRFQFRDVVIKFGQYR
jgi:hypothetical protein